MTSVQRKKKMFLIRFDDVFYDRKELKNFFAFLKLNFIIILPSPLFPYYFSIEKNCNKTKNITIISKARICDLI